MDLNLDFDFNDSLDGLGNTFRAEGMSVAFDKLRVDGHNIDLQVKYEDLILGKRIGQGACSSVNRARHRDTGEMYAVKLFNVYDKSQRSQMLKEISMLLEIDCPALIKLLVSICVYMCKTPSYRVCMFMLVYVSVYRVCSTLKVTLG